MPAGTDFSDRFAPGRLGQAEAPRVSVADIPVPRDPWHSNGYNMLVSASAVMVVFFGHCRPRKGETVSIEYKYEEQI